MKLTISFRYVALGVALFLLLAAHNNVHAALLYFDPDSVSVHRGDTVSVKLRVDVDEGECINTIEAKIHYESSVRAVDVSRGNSILNLWLEDPSIDETNKTITFAGGIPGGYCGRIIGDPGLTNEVIELIFRSPGFSIGGATENKGSRVWIDENVQVLLHDGQGTLANTVLQESYITLLDTPGETAGDAWNQKVQEDEIMPSEFAITLAKDDTAFSGRYFITFNAVDKQSGIDHYEVMEEPFSEFYAFNWGRADAPWIRTESPYVLNDQTLNSTIRVKAIDKAGNERIQVLVPEEAQRSLSKDRIISIALIASLSIVIIGLIVFALYKRRQRLLNEIAEEDGDNDAEM